MEIHREIKLPVPADVARQRLTAAFASTVVVQKGTGLLSRITCTGGFRNDTLTVHYIDQDRSTLHYTLNGHLVDDVAGSRLVATISDGHHVILCYVPVLLWISCWILTNVVPGFTPFTLIALVKGGIATGLLSLFLTFVASLYLRSSANKIETTLVKISVAIS